MQLLIHPRVYDMSLYHDSGHYGSAGEITAA